MLGQVVAALVVFVEWVWQKYSAIVMVALLAVMPEPYLELLRMPKRVILLSGRWNWTMRMPHVRVQEREVSAFRSQKDCIPGVHMAAEDLTSTP